MDKQTKRNVLTAVSRDILDGKEQHEIVNTLAQTFNVVELLEILMESSAWSEELLNEDNPEG